VPVYRKGHAIPGGGPVIAAASMKALSGIACIKALPGNLPQQSITWTGCG